MKILALQGSPRPKGNTQTVLEYVLEAAGQCGAETECIQLTDLTDLSGCMECFACNQEPDEPACAIDDDMRPILLKATEVDVTVWATPVFCWSPAWPLKMAMDRFYCMFKYDEQNNYTSLLRGKKMAAVVTAAGPEGDGADLVTETCRRLSNHSQAQWLGAFVAASVKTPESIRADAELVQRARTFGQHLAK